MKKSSLIICIAFYASLTLYSRTDSDSLVTFSDLNFHSDLEKQATLRFLNNQADAFELFMAIDAEISDSDIKFSENSLATAIFELKSKGIEDKKINKKIKTSYQDIHSKFLNKYNENEYYPVMFRTGTYNCVSASMLYAQVFDLLAIPYKVMASSNHVYLIANPGAKSVVIETTNPDFEKAIFNGEFKRQYVNYLRSSKMISEDEYKNKSSEEIFEERYNEVREVEFANLPGMQYFNKALTMFEQNKYSEAYELSKKAYFYYPDQKVKVLLNNTLLFQLEKSTFDNVADIDYLLQYSRFENADSEIIVGIFGNIINHFLQYTDKEDHCNQLHERLVSNISDENLKEELSFTFNLMMSYRSKSPDTRFHYIERAIRIKNNHRDANRMFISSIDIKLNDIHNSHALLDTIEYLSTTYDYEFLTPVLDGYRLFGYLRVAEDEFEDKNIKEGEFYLDLFEQNCTPPIEETRLRYVAERVYRKIGVYYFYRNKTKAREVVNRGLTYVPNSRSIKSAIY